MSSRYKVADILWTAANQYLWTGEPRPDGVYEGWEYSCNAVIDAIADSNTAYYVREFLRSCGCSAGSTTLLLDFDAGKERQGVRYMWLLFAMHLAEDEDLETGLHARMNTP